VRVAEAKERLESLQRDLEDLHAEDPRAIDQKAAEVRQRIDAERTSAEELRADAATWRHEQEEDGEERVRSWRAKRAVRPLERRADRAEEYAFNALVNALIDADVAELAILEAFQARLDAEAAAA
jgi:hypothetical protein